MFTIPDRAGSMTGMEFAGTIMAMGLTPEREQVIYEQFELGNVPDFMRTPVEVQSRAGSHEASFYVMPDVLCIGTDDDFVRIPMNPMTAQKIANLFTCTLITPRMSDLIWLQSVVKLVPETMPPTGEMSTTKWFLDHNVKIETARGGRTGLIAGHKKDVVITSALSDPALKDRRVAIYGWHELDGKPIQGLNPSSHGITYADYSHGIRLAALDMVCDSLAVDFVNVAADADLAALITGSGPLTYPRYPTQ